MSLGLVECLQAKFETSCNKGCLVVLHLATRLKEDYGRKAAEMLEPYLLEWFFQTFRKGNEGVRRSAFSIRKSQPIMTLISAGILGEIDCAAQSMDPAWPTEALSQDTLII